MTQVFNDAGRAIPATVVSVSPMKVTQVKDKEKDGYSAVQVGTFPIKEKSISKSLKNKPFKNLHEFRTEKESNFKVGQEIEADIFEEGDTVNVSGISKGKGFQGVVKRHGFAGGPRTHGQKHSERAPGSIGVGGVQRVIKGTRMAGRMGGQRITVQNLKVLKVDKNEGKIYISGAVPGRRGTVIEIESLSDDNSTKKDE